MEVPPRPEDRSKIRARSEKMPTKAELEEQLEQAEAKLSGLETELQSAKAEIQRLLAEKAESERRWKEKLEASEREFRANSEASEGNWREKLEVALREAELQRYYREKEELRLKMEGAHERELEVHRGLRQALERRLADKEAELLVLETAGRGRPASGVDGDSEGDSRPASVVAEDGEGGARTESGMTGVRPEGGAGDVSVGEGHSSGTTEVGGSTGDGPGGGADPGSGSSVGSPVGVSGRPVSGTTGGGGMPGGGALGESGFTESHATHGDGGADATAAVGPPGTRVSGDGDRTVVDSGRVGHGMRLPPLPEFRADNASDHEGEAYERWLRKLTKHAELQRWSERDKLLQFELHLSGKAESIYEVLPEESKVSFSVDTKALGDHLRPAGRKALTSAQLLRRKQKMGESVDEFVQAFEELFEKSYGRQTEIDPKFKGTLKRDLFVQGLNLKWQEKVLPTAETFADALHQARTAEEQERQLIAMHRREAPRNMSGGSYTPKKSARTAEQGGIEVELPRQEPGVKCSATSAMEWDTSPRIVH